MMKHFLKTIIAIALIGGLIQTFIWCTNKTKTSDEEKTEIIITNQDTVDVKVYFTIGVLRCKNDTISKNPLKIKKDCKDSLAFAELWETDVFGMFGSTTHGTSFEFTLHPKDSVFYTPSKGIQGNISFITLPFQCDPAIPYTTGSNIIEFCLNNKGTVLNAQETIEISCVSGVTFIGKVDFYKGGIWTANYPGYDTITTVQNGDFGTNTNRVGVYPVGCDDCTSIADPPSCTKPNGYHEQPSKNAICNVQRNANSQGGKVVFSFIRPSISIADK